MANAEFDIIRPATIPDTSRHSELGYGNSQPPNAQPKQGAGYLLPALAVSCILHAVVFVVPLLGEHTQVEQAIARTPRPSPGVFLVALPTPRSSALPVSIAPPAMAEAIADIAAQPGIDGKEAAQPRMQTEGADILPFPGPSYYTTDQLTKRPEAVAVAELDTADTRSIIVSGGMILQLRIDDLGHVVDVVVEQSELPEIFIATAINAFRHSRFKPGELNGKRVSTMMRIEVRYDDARLTGG
ncbi:MAG: energy transducer TonB [Gammaproteobacteria bacterium]|nr:hypothetical protein [Rhodocyclaceae bacterium]MBU3910430.1 energy transducer TonB [Gammaproteobacteria bacterium]MBU3990721.1 energy transducer TonB [Gammaproteobacteria bacterium]MBU4004911.1 energy transducer TonB [Gammaproteobacteria bacterium]MBU4020504.1 energy transducer TonB [Gammaproteobacteria bacterium]